MLKAFKCIAHIQQERERVRFKQGGKIECIIDPKKHRKNIKEPSSGEEKLTVGANFSMKLFTYPSLSLLDVSFRFETTYASLLQVLFETYL